MKRILSIVLAVLMLFTITAFAQEEYSESANIDYGYDESYDETEKQDEITTGKSDDISTSYDEDYDESGTQDITSGKYDDVSQSYNKEYDESVANTETPQVGHETSIAPLSLMPITFKISFAA